MSLCAQHNCFDFTYLKNSFLTRACNRGLFLTVQKMKKLNLWQVIHSSTVCLFLWSHKLYFKHNFNRNTHTHTSLQIMYTERSAANADILEANVTEVMNLDCFSPVFFWVIVQCLTFTDILYSYSTDSSHVETPANTCVKVTLPLVMS